MKPITFRHAELSDVPLLARMNKQLIQDEGSRNAMNLAELEQRMRGWLAGDGRPNPWRAILIQVGELVVGYCLYQERRDEYEPEQGVFYVRQFFVAWAWRRQGVGRRAFERIVAVVIPDEARLELDVLSCNAAGQAFWVSLGFTSASVTMRRAPNEALCAADDATF